MTHLDMSEIPAAAVSFAHRGERPERGCFGLGRMRSIAPRGGTAPNTRAGISCSLPLGMHRSPHDLLGITKPTMILVRGAITPLGAIRSIRENPKHPRSSRSVSVARRSGVLN